MGNSCVSATSPSPRSSEEEQEGAKLLGDDQGRHLDATMARDGRPAALYRGVIIGVTNGHCSRLSSTALT